MKVVKLEKNLGRVHIEMMKAVIAFALAPANLLITKSIPAFEIIINLLKSNLTAIANLQKIASSPVTGYASQKKALKNTLVEFSSSILQSVAAFAVNTGNDVLLKKVLVSRSDLNRMTYEGLLDYVSGTIEVVTPLVSELDAYNIDAATITLWQTNWNQLNDVFSNPKNQHAHQNTIKRDIDKIVLASMNMLYGQADQVALQFKVENLSYYTEYKFNRKLIPLSRHTKFKVKVTNEVNEPIVNVIVSQIGTENSVKTDLKGEASLRIKIVEGKDPLYNFMLSKEGNSKETGLIEIKKGETVSRNVVMAPTGFVLPAPVEEKVLVEKRTF